MRILHIGQSEAARVGLAVHFIIFGLAQFLFEDRSIDPQKQARAIPKLDHRIVRNFMSFSPTVRAAFEKWICTPTWYKSHPLDEQRFFRFVWTVLVFSRRRPTESDLYSEITEYANGTIDGDELIRLARQFSNRYEDLYSFARARRSALRDSS